MENWKWKVFEGHYGVGYVVPDLLKFLEEENPIWWNSNRYFFPI